MLGRVKCQSHCFRLQREFVLSFPITISTFLPPHFNLIATTQHHLTSASHTYCTARTSIYIQYTAVTMSSENIPLNTTVSFVEARFPDQHIKAFGAGEVGPVYVTLSPGGKVIKAEAELIQAPFKKMLIDDPKILKIFDERGKGIDINLLHPAAKFRLDPLKILDDEGGELDMSNFDVGRLVDITHLPRAAKYGWSEHHLSKADPEEEGEVHKRVREIVEDEEQKKVERQSLKRKAPSTQPPLTQTRTQRKEAVKAETEKEALTQSNKKKRHVKQAAKADTRPEPYLFSPASNPHAVIKVKKPEPTTDTPRSWPPSHDSEHPSVVSKRLPKTPASIPSPRKGRNTGPIPNTVQGQKMRIPYDQIMAKLSESDQASYEAMVTTERRDAAKNDHLRRLQAARIHAFVRKHDIVSLHNAYAEALKRSGSNKAYQLPTFEEPAKEMSGKMDLDGMLVQKAQDLSHDSIGKVVAHGNPDATFD